MKTVGFVELMNIVNREKLTWVNMRNKIPTVNGYGRNGVCYSWHGRFADCLPLVVHQKEDKILVEIATRNKGKRIRELQNFGYICTTVCDVPDMGYDSRFDTTYYIAERGIA